MLFPWARSVRRPIDAVVSFGVGGAAALAIGTTPLVLRSRLSKPETAGTAPLLGYRSLGSKGVF